MSWATRATLILGIPWGLFTGPIVFMAARDDGQWIYAPFMLWIIPIGLAWTLLRLALGNRGAVRYH